MDAGRRDWVPGTKQPIPAASEIREAIALAEEQEIRLARQRSLLDLRYFAELLYPPDDPDRSGFWMRFCEPVEWLLELLMCWKAEGTIEVLPGFEVILEDKGRVIAKPEKFDLSGYTTLQIRQSRETLKTGTRRLDFIHDLVYWPLVKKTPAACAWFAHKLEMARLQSINIKKEICASEPFYRVWKGILVPEHRDPGKMGTADYFDTPCHPLGAPEHAAVFLAVGARYEGGRYRSGHFDDLVTGEDRDSVTIRETKARNISDRENERDRTIGRRVIQGTDHHPDDAYQREQAKRGVFTVKMPAIRGNARAFFDFVDLPTEERERPSTIAKYNKICPPVFKHLDLLTLARTCDSQGRITFASQMLLQPDLGGQSVFDTRRIMVLPLDVVEPLLTGIGFICFDECWKTQENKFSGDHAAIGYFQWDRHGRRVLLDGAYGNDLAEDEGFAEIGRLSTSYPTEAIYTERQSVASLESHWQTFAFKNNCPVASLTELEKAGRANKHGRILSSEPYYRRGEIVLIKGTEIADAVLKEAGSYDKITGAAGPDDALDMVSMSLDPMVGTPLPGESPNRWGYTGSESAAQESDDAWLP